MFDLVRPCADCPFRIGYGSRFQMPRERLEEILHAPSFVCHKTALYDDDGQGYAGPKSQHCAGLSALLMRDRRPNQMMRIGMRIGMFDPTKLDPDGEAYRSIREARAAHAGKEPK